MKRTLAAVVPVELEFAAAMEPALREVLEGEYDAPFVGEALSILDVGANVGAFSIWANLRDGAVAVIKALRGWRAGRRGCPSLSNRRR